MEASGTDDSELDMVRRLDPMDRISAVPTGSQASCLGLQSSVSLSGNRAKDTGPGQPENAAAVLEDGG